MYDYTTNSAVVDDTMQSVMSTLDEIGATNNTLIIYMSDRGVFLGEHGMYGSGFSYEENVHIPLVMNYPGFIKKKYTTDLVQTIDVTATILDIAGATKPDSVKGQSLVPYMKGETPQARNYTYYYFYESPGWNDVRKSYSVRNDKLKLIKYYGDDIKDYEMYDMKGDKGEDTNLYGQAGHEDDQKMMMDLLAEAQKAYGDTDHDQDAPHWLNAQNNAIIQPI